MKALLRWIVILLGGLVILLVVAAITVYFMSERALDQRYTVPQLTLATPTEPAEIAEGQRLATLLDCFGGCHGKEGEGRVMFDVPMVARVVAPNLSSAARRFSEVELAAIIRNGVRPDGSSLMIMPSEAFHSLNDQDLARLIAFLKSIAPTDGPGPEIALGPLGRVGLALGKFQPAAQLAGHAAQPPEAENDEAAKGRYMAGIVCAPCHGTDLRGTSNPDFTAPDLRVVAAYSAPAFSKLMGSGVSIAGKDIMFMKNLALLSDAEVAALYAYLHTLR